MVPGAREACDWPSRWLSTRWWRHLISWFTPLHFHHCLNRSFLFEILPSPNTCLRTCTYIRMHVRTYHVPSLQNRKGERLHFYLDITIVIKHAHVTWMSAVVSQGKLVLFSTEFKMLTMLDKLDIRYCRLCSMFLLSVAGFGRLRRWVLSVVFSLWSPVAGQLHWLLAGRLRRWGLCVCIVCPL